MTIVHEQSLLPSFFSEQLERIINSALRYAPGARQALNELAGKTLCLKTTRPNVVLFIGFQLGDVRVTHYSEDTPTATVQGPLFTLMTQMGLKRSTGDLIGSGIRIDGNQHLVQQVADIFRDLDLDLEEPIAQLIGDVAAHQIGNVTRSAFSWFKKTTQTMMENTGHYLQNESLQVIERHNLDTFSRDVDQIRSDFDRLEARVKRFQQQQKLMAESPPQP